MGERPVIRCDGAFPAGAGGGRLAGVASISDRVTRRFVGAYDDESVSATFRARRFEALRKTFPNLSEMTVLDIGGDARSWRLAGLRPKELILLNVFDQPVEEPWMRSIKGDACAPPRDLPLVDLVYSNSVIEHVGGHWRRERFAETVHALAPAHWIQTPWRYFPIEPHYLAPFAQQMPLAMRAKFIEHWPVGHLSGTPKEELLETLMDHELLTVAEMRHYFPGSELRRERVVGVTKSIIAVAGA